MIEADGTFVSNVSGQTIGRTFNRTTRHDDAAAVTVVTTEDERAVASLLQAGEIDEVGGVDRTGEAYR